MKLKMDFEGNVREFQVEQPCTYEEQEDGSYHFYSYPLPLDETSTPQPVESKVLIGKYGQREVVESMVEYTNRAFEAGDPEVTIRSTGMRFKWLHALVKKSPRFEALLNNLLETLLTRRK